MARCWEPLVSSSDIFSTDGDDRLLLVNLGDGHELNPASEPLLAPLLDYRWETLWTSESPQYGGSGGPITATKEQWVLPADATVALRPATLEK